MHWLDFCRPKKSYTFERLELAITSFLSTFYSLMNRLLMGLHEKSTMGSRLDLQMSAHRKDSVGSKSGNIKESGLVSGKLVKQGSWSMQNQDAFQEFEKSLESFSIRGEGSQQHDFLFFDLQYLTGGSGFPEHSMIWFSDMSLLPSRLEGRVVVDLFIHCLPPILIYWSCDVIFLTVKRALIGYEVIVLLSEK